MRGLRITLFLALILFLAGCSDVQSTQPTERATSAGLERSQRERSRPAAKQPDRRSSAPEASSKTAAKRRARAATARTVAGSPTRANVRVMFRRLRVREEGSSSPYSRDAFKHWIDADGDGCDTRREVLRRENRATRGTGTCGAERGRWVSAYDGQVTADPSAFDVDHLVPLAEAWRSGADQWPDAKREAFANDLHPFSLIAVSASSNRSKSDSDPSGWMPTNSRYHCQYVARWIAVKFRWRLTVDPSEHRAISRTLESCDPESLQLRLRVRRGATP